MADLLLDTEIFIDHLRGSHRLVVGTDAIHYSIVTRAELFAGRGSEESQISLLLAPFLEVALDRPIAERAGRLRRSSPIRLPDALIAASAIERDCLLVTRNVRDFRGIEGLQLRPPRT